MLRAEWPGMSYLMISRAQQGWRILLVMTLLVATSWAQPFPPSPGEQEAGFLFRQGLVLLEQGQDVRAVDLFRQALRLEPERLEIRPYLARALYDGGEYEPALRQLELYLGAEPEDAKVAFLRARILTALKRYGQAEDALDILALTYDEASWEWHNLKGYLQEQQGRNEEAEASYRKAAKLSDDSREPDVNLVTLLLREERVDEAGTIVTELLSEAPEDPQILNVFALLLSQKEEGFDPAPLIEKLRETTLPFELQYNFTAALAERGSVSEAGVLAGDLVDRFPDDARASWLYGRVLLQRRELQDAGEYLLAARERLPLTEEVAATMGSYSYLISDFPEASRWFAEALDRDPENGLSAHNLSLALSRQDKLEEAISASRRAVALLEEDPRVVYQLALVLDRNGDLEEAKTEYRRFLEVTEDTQQKEIVREHLKEMESKK